MRPIPGIVTVWPTGTTEKIEALKGFSDWVRSLAFSPDGRILATGSLDKTVRLWDTEKWRLLRTLQHDAEVDAVAFSPNGATLAVGTRAPSRLAQPEVRLWDAESGNLTRTLPGYSGSIVQSLAFSQDGSLLATGSGGLDARGTPENTVRVWDTATWQSRHSLVDHTAGTVFVGFFSNCRILVGVNSQTVRLWDAQTGEVLRTVAQTKDPSGHFQSVAFAPDRMLLVIIDGGRATAWDFGER
jgi:WD40 repeat protein